MDILSLIIQRGLAIKQWMVTSAREQFEKIVESYTNIFPTIKNKLVLHRLYMIKAIRSFDEQIQSKNKLAKENVPLLQSLGHVKNRLTHAQEQHAAYHQLLGQAQAIIQTIETSVNCLSSL